MIRKAKASPHGSDNSHGRLYETMPAEYALDASWHDRMAPEKVIEMRNLILRSCIVELLLSEWIRRQSNKGGDR